MVLLVVVLVAVVVGVAAALAVVVGCFLMMGCEALLDGLSDVLMRCGRILRL